MRIEYFTIPLVLMVSFSPRAFSGDCFESFGPGSLKYLTVEVPFEELASIDVEGLTGRDDSALKMQPILLGQMGEKIRNFRHLETGLNSVDGSSRAVTQVTKAVALLVFDPRVLNNTDWEFVEGRSRISSTAMLSAEWVQHWSRLSEYHENEDLPARYSVDVILPAGRKIKPIQIIIPPGQMDVFKMWMDGRSTRLCEVATCTESRFPKIVLPQNFIVIDNSMRIFTTGADHEIENVRTALIQHLSANGVSEETVSDILQVMMNSGFNAEIDVMTRGLLDAQNSAVGISEEVFFFLLMENSKLPTVDQRNAARDRLRDWLRNN